jgi:NADPH:quinone reductase-like Zn-dependent oxidoreductase
MIKALGAEHVSDYRDANAVEQIKTKYPDLTYVFDTIGSSDSSALAAGCVTKQGKLCTVRPGKANTESVPKHVAVSDVLVWTAFLSDHRYGDFFWPVRTSSHSQ